MIKKTFSVFFHILTIIIFLSTLVVSVFVYNVVNDLEIRKFIYADNQVPTIIYDYKDKQVRSINNKYPLTVKYEEIPEQFISALISAEDARFFKHDGVDLPRLFSALINNLIAQNSIQGGSTLTQQLIKNEYLTNQKTIKRKIQEMYLAYKLEKELSKEEIFEAYCNLILFDGITPGVNNASHKFFNKDISEVNIVESAMLAALVKSPTLYNPFRYPQNALNRRNYVLEEMYQNGYISYNQKILAQEVTIDEMLYHSQKSEISYDYQAYLDIVYDEAYQLTGYDPFSKPMKIYTYLDSQLQMQLDLIQEGKDTDIEIIDENQQLACAVIDNKNGSVVGVIGGKDYKGERLFNRAYNMKRQPGSTMKPIFSYALAVEYLKWNSSVVVDDIPYKYPGTNINVSNVDNTYMGELTIVEALGYSRNTTALSTLEKIINKIGLTKTIKYLENLGILDCNYDQFNMSYGLGGMINGISPIQLAAAYRILQAEGKYIEPTTIRKIELYDGTVLYKDRREVQVLSSETAFIMSDVLKRVVDNNYWGVGSLKVDGSDIGVKSGTTDFDNPTAYGYPLNASKDVWYAGISKDYTFTVWTGFDKAEVGSKNYFKASGDNQRVGIAKKTLSKLIALKVKKNQKFDIPKTLTKVSVVKGKYPYRLPNQYTPSDLIDYAYFKNDEMPTQSILPSKLPELTQVDTLFLGNKMIIIFPPIEQLHNKKEYGKTIYSDEKIFGKIQYVVEYNDMIIRSDKNIIELVIDGKQSTILQCYYGYEKGDITSNYYPLNITL